MSAVQKKGKVSKKGPNPAGRKADPGDLIEMDEAIDILKTTRPTFYRWLRSGKINGMKVGRQWRFYRRDVLTFLKGESPSIDLPADIAPLFMQLSQFSEKSGKGELAVPDEDKAKLAAYAILTLGIGVGASDIHIEPLTMSDAGGEAALLRYRIGGVLTEIANFDCRLLPHILNMYKTMTCCDVRETAKPQNGSIFLTVNGQEIYVEVCFLPTARGESMTARVFNKQRMLLDLDKIDYAKRDREKLEAAIVRSYGTILFAGPLGSGKKTSLHCALTKALSEEKKAISIERQIHMLLPMLTQIILRADEGMTFPEAIRAALKCAPNIIMTEEIEDTASADLLAQAALTGHQIFSTVNAKDAAEAVIKIRRLVSDGYSLAGALTVVSGQKLVRSLCGECAKPYRPSQKDRELIAEIAKRGGLVEAEIGSNFRQPNGCPACNHTGFKGRNVIAEIMEISDEIAALIRGGADADAIRARAVHEGMTTLGADGIRKASQGMFFVEEIFSITNAGSNE